MPKGRENHFPVREFHSIQIAVAFNKRPACSPDLDFTCDWIKTFHVKRVVNL